MEINPQLVEWLKAELNNQSEKNELIIFDDESNTHDSEQSTLFYACMVNEARVLNLIAFDRIASWGMVYKLTAIGEIALDIQAAAKAAPTGDGGADNVLTGEPLQAEIMEYLAHCDPHFHDGKRTVTMVYDALLESDSEYEVLFSEVDTALGRLFLDGKLETILRDDMTWYRVTTPATTQADSTAGYRVEHSDQLIYDGKRVHFQNDFSLILHPTDVAKLAALLNTETAALRAQLTSAQERVWKLEAELLDAKVTIQFAKEQFDYGNPNAAHRMLQAASEFDEED